MKKIILTMFLLALLTLTGCGGAAQEASAQTKTPAQTKPPLQTEASTQNLTILMGSGVHSNTQAANLEAFAPYVREACEHEDSIITLITVEGDPQVAATITVPALPAFVSDAVAERETNNRCEQILSIAGALRATSPESDLLGALRLASRSCSGQSGDNILLVADPGLTTIDPLPMQMTVFDDRWDETYIDAIIADLQAQRALPDLSGFSTCLWVGLGDTQLPQSDLSSANVEALQMFWNRALQAAGTQLTCSDLPPVGSAAPAADLPPVSTVTVVHEASVFADDQLPREGMVLTEQQATFLPNSTEFRDRTQAEAALKSIADACQTGVHYLICGQTATAGDEETCRAFSISRATAVRDLLVAMGVPEGNLQCFGAGYSSILHIADLDADGSLLPDAAEKNRSVYILPMDSSLAKAVLAGG